MTQQDKLLGAFRNAPDQILSMGYIERELYMSQGNARLKDLKGKGYIFKDAGNDIHGFKMHKLISGPDQDDKPKSVSKPVFGSTSDIYKSRKRYN